MLTTVDNPFDPFTEYDEWYAYDLRAGYHSTELLARIVRSSEELSDPDQAAAEEEAIDEIVNVNASGMHKKVSRSDATDSISS
jgi:hypothetical protein